MCVVGRPVRLKRSTSAVLANGVAYFRKRRTTLHYNSSLQVFPDDVMAI